MKLSVLAISALFLFSFCTSNSKETNSSNTNDSVGKEEKKEIQTAKIKPVVIEKEFAYNQHTLEDSYPYKDTIRVFQWDKIKNCLAKADSLQYMSEGRWGVVQNKRDKHGLPPLTKEHGMNEYKIETDKYGIDRQQAAPVYVLNDTLTPERYELDGALFKINGEQGSFFMAETTNFDGEYLIPMKYAHIIEEQPTFQKVIVVDRNNQNISTFEKDGDTWKVRSMNPCTTGAHHPPLQKPTPLGMFVIQEKKPKMMYYVDGTTEIGGYAPWANRFCEGAYLHGVPVNLPHTEIIEYSSTLGTIPRSHMCVRNASSHAKYIYDNFPIDQTLVYVIE